MIGFVNDFFSISIVVNKPEILQCTAPFKNRKDGEAKKLESGDTFSLVYELQRLGNHILNVADRIQKTFSANNSMDIAFTNCNRLEIVNKTDVSIICQPFSTQKNCYFSIGYNLIDHD